MPTSPKQSPLRHSSFGEAFDPRSNAFAFLRLAFALAVIVSHTFATGGFGPDLIDRLTGGSNSIADISVAAFFLLSGFLITRSSLRSPGVGRFLWHRFLRILPGYWVCLVITAFLFSPLFAFIKGAHFFAAPSFAYIRSNWTMFHLNGFSIAGIIASDSWFLFRSIS